MNMPSYSSWLVSQFFLWIKWSQASQQLISVSHAVNELSMGLFPSGLTVLTQWTRTRYMKCYLWATLFVSWLSLILEHESSRWKNSYLFSWFVSHYFDSLFYFSEHELGKEGVTCGHTFVGGRMGGCGGIAVISTAGAWQGAIYLPHLPNFCLGIFKTKQKTTVEKTKDNEKNEGKIL